jgi:ubiquinone/menaquinone biosynthesis C-methylase UbiE
MKAADLGCGPGFWTMPLADIVGAAGAVVGIDVSRELLDELAARHPPAHVRIAEGELPAISLPDGTLDFAWVAFVFHEVEPPATLAAELRRVLRPGGIAAILDWRPDAVSESGPPRHHRLSADQVIGHLKTAGFVDCTEKWRDDDAYLVQVR